MRRRDNYNQDIYNKVILKADDVRSDVKCRRGEIPMHYILVADGFD